MKKDLLEFQLSIYIYIYTHTYIHILIVVDCSEDSRKFFRSGSCVQIRMNAIKQKNGFRYRWREEEEDAKREENVEGRRIKYHRGCSCTM